MYLKAITLQGFKSFADKTVLRFEPGVTAIVGPNGCGKSNIADAIRWVLGEQSAKALRGGKMQDVIFEGADTRKAAQLCEVSLLLTDCEHQLGSDFHEIEILRRGHRDGQGEYFFNGQPCRLKDIHKLFMDTGIGRTSYSIMAQGQIDQILSSKPEERRAVFEEAAGITKYKSHRREALNKLALTEQNLARISDIVGEVSRQIGSLRRQAAKAMRYKRLSHRLRHLSLAWSGRQYGILMQTVAGLEATVGSLRSGATERKASLEAQQAALDAAKARRSTLNQRVQDAQQAVFDLRSQREEASNTSRLALARRAGLEDRLAAARAGLVEVEMQIREVTAQSDTGEQDKQMQLNLLGSSDAVFQEKSRELALAEGKVGKFDQDLQQARFELLQLESTVARLRTDCSGYEVEQKTSQHRHDSLAVELAQVKREEEAAAAALAALARRLAEATSAQAQANEALGAAQASVSDLTGEFRDAQRRLQEIDRQLAQRGARLKLLQQLQERWEGFGEGAKALLQGRLEAALGGRKAASIMSGIEVRAEFGAAMEALLGSAAEAIDVADIPTARRVLDQLEREKIGAAVLRVSDVGPRPVPARELPAGLIPAISTLAGAAEGHPASALLSACYVADEIGAFLDYWRANPDFEFLAVATRKGEVVDRRGLVTGGHLEGKRRSSGIVQRDIDLRETNRMLGEDQRLHDEQKARIDALAASLAQAEQALEARRAEVLAATQAAASVQADHRSARQSADDVSNRVRRREAELAALVQARDEAQARWTKAQAGVAEAEAAAEAHRQVIRGLEEGIEHARNSRDACRDMLAQARLELADRRQKVEVIDRGLGEMQRRRDQLAELLTQRHEEIETWTVQIAALGGESASQEARAAKLAETLAVSQQQVEAIRADLAAIEFEIGALESSQVSLRETADAAHDELSAHEVKLAESRQRAEFSAAEAAREFQADLAGVDWKAMLWKADDEPEGLKDLDLDEEEGAAPAAPAPAGASAAAAPSDPAKAAKPRRRREKARGEPTEADLAAMDSTDWDAVKAEVDALRQRLSSMGAVNLVAIEEYSELKQRHDFLKGQSDDLLAAKAELTAAIEEINQTSLQQFAVAFEQIRKNFAYTFQTLFGGGRAELQLMDTGDPLESGIEIVAQPPGTKLKGITLLSGGQKTLTAVALLFALYMVKPSPFCLLDELDAPLDESNIGRFTDLLRKFVKESQFIIITHNKRTVAAANAIYGVTMEERGVSKTISMRFNHERGEAEAHPRTIAEAVVTAQPAVPAPA
jgi:chromosome segregation protein